MKKLYLIICVICLTLIMSDIAKATIPVVWQADPNGSGVLANCISRVKLTPDNNYVMVFHNMSEYDIPARVDKLDASTGNFVWPLPGYKTVTKPGERISMNGWVDSSGNLYIMPSYSGHTIWKYDSELSTELCSYTTYGSGFEYVMDAIDDCEYLYVAGTTGSWSNDGSRLVKLDESCNEIWTCLSKNTSDKDAYGRGIALDSSKNVFRVGTDSSFGASDRGRLIGHSASDGTEFCNYIVDEINSSITGITIDSSDYIYIAYCYDYTPSGQERTVIQKLVRNGDTADVMWEYRFDDIGMFLREDCIVKHTDDSFYVAFELRQGGTTVPGIAEFDLNGNLLWKETIDRPGWIFHHSSIEAKDAYIYVGLNKADDQSQTQVLCLLPFVLLSPDGGEKWVAGTNQTIEWNNCGPNINYVLIEYSTDNGLTWNDVDIWENTGSYEWYPIPAIDSNQCLVRVSDLFNSNNYDTSDGVFTIFRCLNPIAGDLNGDCYVDFRDFAIFAEQWLNCGNPFDSACQP